MDRRLHVGTQCSLLMYSLQMHSLTWCLTLQWQAMLMLSRTQIQEIKYYQWISINCVDSDSYCKLQRMKIWAEKATKSFSTLLMVTYIVKWFWLCHHWCFLIQIWLRWFWLCHSYWFCEFDKADDQSRLLQHHIWQIWFYQYSYDQYYQ